MAKAGKGAPPNQTFRSDISLCTTGKFQGVASAPVVTMS